MGIFGWSYPPGAAGDPFAPYNAEDPPCSVCARDVDSCICPECDACGVQGDPACYDGDALYHVSHGLVRNDAQRASAEAARLVDEQHASDARAEAEAEPLRAAEEEQYWNELDEHHAHQARKENEP